jgi:hypothetical protein
MDERVLSKLFAQFNTAVFSTAVVAWLHPGAGHASGKDVKSNNGFL